MGGALIPRSCDAAALPGQSNQCGQDPYIVLPDRSECVDQQTLKMQVGGAPRGGGGAGTARGAAVQPWGGHCKTIW